ncbi:MAG: tRNA (guanine-N(1)-)-methyltransferase [Candidatus Uhrbacteria bacterium GW2011_GWD2_41_121]|uniref:tRNA (guanine-N(1)-)-methyltransferase n=1 Tax=Candidatus Uhrbacteria bacterium GW2011_GWC1_41_20 TaxID=1618983 RepID=A0A0G0VG84_9BACT|nr:MAG: tRNA (guanine-N(1)-)-methyltransferase [Candidatus Uhrbacteria bacterium GW2011_GWE1_39_46]KKR64431.1 MAG: tRNA (guanine-N(1)-)-methyltransferase [Candidatus Uhrbacteria bacterium GW2011_GWC2_40_450]KKR90690.1 MAG: tRNA (guanine-N(1)-)-methyltransferase [Candidatus Uhrbacteria bacterium GW2011_GWD2_41_121]KKR96593.1 MAG: tRNA (guanine-N(1)-)-methyltransferase [Candidatus Uhrbacteria bacterium GW2011_GWD1_41_16]KKR99984.1 MAG: tRNA (guanine-N(1)-)-methyltransferase [Candidatus Uhrbacteri
MKKFDIITLFPDVIEPYAKASILGRAQKKKLIKIKAHNLRRFSKDKHKKVDDTPYGGGPGMLMTVQPIDNAVRKVRNKLVKKKTRVILTAANGRMFNQFDAKRLAKYDQLIFICGRYEGIDHRVEESIADEVFSVGEYVLTGGELPALIMTDAIARNVSGVLGAESSLESESYNQTGILEYPQYTKPEIYRFRSGLKKKELKVPKVLLSGDHVKIEAWKQEQSKKRSGK